MLKDRGPAPEGRGGEAWPLRAQEAERRRRMAQEALDRERARCRALQGEVERLRAERDRYRTRCALAEGANAREGDGLVVSISAGVVRDREVAKALARAVDTVGAALEGRTQGEYAAAFRDEGCVRAQVSGVRDLTLWWVHARGVVAVAPGGTSPGGRSPEALAEDARGQVQREAKALGSLSETRTYVHRWTPGPWPEAARTVPWHALERGR